MYIFVENMLQYTQTVSVITIEKTPQPTKKGSVVPEKTNHNDVISITILAYEPTVFAIRGMSFLLILNIDIKNYTL